ncbi:UDP-2,3-diacylglucosamine hydrolase [Achromobacter xylosoxidans]|uniref:UDP-2,3-diacylglucosamine diphosphatase n=1 Tax=Achromobacter aegrifaciens TaxID=1287736 RepID=UPI000D4A9820|nr:UDP-2,3-diacylglucosamine diphosphatase [Achromobacter aegrifaciens]MDQ1758885.1 UDP-2,3-diacylglucosamine diphosphatase [Achromobacter aegrifaciens]PTN51395.1 UDP-2,3-diacylglucosamine hydrolase [Achromobacter xylosoxidans]
MSTAPGKATVNEIRPAHWRALWISDIHLGTAGCKAEFLLDFLDHNDSDTLYLVGDIVDGWQLRKHWHWPRAHNDVIQRILRKARNGTRVVFIPGNHDEFAREFAGYAFGDIEILDEDVHTTAKGQRLLVLHGDQFDGVIQHSRWLAHLGDGLYQLALWINHHFNRLRHRLGLHYWSLSQYLKHKVKNAVSFITDFEEALAGEARRRGLDGVVCGHIHKAELRYVAEILYCNDGDWVESLSALAETHDGQLQLLDWATVMADREADPAARPPRSLTLPALPSALRRQGKHP